MGERSAGQNAGSGGEADEVLHPLPSVQFSELDAEIPGYGTVVVTDVDGGLHVAVPHGGDRASHPGFAYLPTDAAATGASPGLSLVRSLGGGWFEAELLAT